MTPPHLNTYVHTHTHMHTHTPCTSEQPPQYKENNSPVFSQDLMSFVVIIVIVISLLSFMIGEIKIVKEATGLPV